MWWKSGTLQEASKTYAVLKQGGQDLRGNLTSQEVKQRRQAVLEALLNTCKEKGFAELSDCDHLGIPQRTLYRITERLVVREHKFSKRGSQFVLSEVVKNEAATEEPSEIVRHATTADVLKDFEAKRPPEAEVLASVPPDPYQNIHNAWEYCRTRIPPHLLDQAKRTFDRSIAAGNPIKNTVNNLLNVSVPMWEREIKEEHFQAFLKIFPQYKDNREEYMQLLD
jgi:hypothetical protein